MGRIAWIAVPLVLLTAAPAGQAGLLRAAERAAEAGAKGAEATATGVKIEHKVGPEVTGASAEVNGVKFAPGVGSGSGGGSGEENAPVWFGVLFVVGIVGWVLWKFRGKPA